MKGSDWACGRCPSMASDAARPAMWHEPHDGRVDGTRPLLT